MIKDFLHCPVVILAGGLGTRIQANFRGEMPKSLVKVGNYPIIHHILMYYAKYGFKNFIICTGYKHDYIKKYFKENYKKYLNISIKLKYTGRDSNTGKRILKIKKFIKSFFLLTYCDSLTNQNIKKTFDIFIKSKKIGLITGVNPKSRFGVLSLKNNNIKDFNEKETIKNLWVNAGIYFFSKEIFNFIKGSNPIFEKTSLKLLAKKNKLILFKHRGFWKCMDTIKDKLDLDKMWEKNPKWKNW